MLIPILVNLLVKSVHQVPTLADLCVQFITNSMENHHYRLKLLPGEMQDRIDEQEMEILIWYKET